MEEVLESAKNSVAYAQALCFFLAYVVVVLFLIFQGYENYLHEKKRKKQELLDKQKWENFLE